jgi:hypothetical protein
MAKHGLHDTSKTVCDDQIQVAVVIKINAGQERGNVRQHDFGRSLKGAIAIAQKHPHLCLANAKN